MTLDIIQNPLLLRKLLRYDPDTGHLFWLERPAEMFSCEKQTAERNAAKWNNKHSGKAAFTAPGSTGYFCGKIFGKRYSAHRICWAIYYGKWPKNNIDHIDGVTTNNKISNLRDVNDQENSINRKISSANKSGMTGVVWNKNLNKWHAYITYKRKTSNLGFYENFNEAVSKRKEAEIKYGFSCRGNVCIEKSTAIE